MCGTGETGFGLGDGFDADRTIAVPPTVGDADPPLPPLPLVVAGAGDAALCAEAAAAAGRVMPVAPPLIPYAASFRTAIVSCKEFKLSAINLLNSSPKLYASSRANSFSLIALP